MKKTLQLLGALLGIVGANAQNAGTLDSEFAIGGYGLYDGYNNTGEHYWDMIPLANDQFIKVGYTDDGNDKDVLLAKFQSNGTPDSTFGTNGFQKIDMSLGLDEEGRGIGVLDNGQFIVTGFITGNGVIDAFAMRLNADGSVDNSFGSSNGHTKINAGDNAVAYGNNVIIDGSVIFIGGSLMNGGNADVFVTKLTTGGGINTSFSSSGFALIDIEGGNDYLNTMKRTSNGGFLFCGMADSSGTDLGFITALNSFGTPATFGTNGVAKFNNGSDYNEFSNMIVTSDNKIIVSGSEGTDPNINGFVRRYNSDGSLDLTFASNGMMMSDPGATTSLFFRGLTLTSQGHIIAAGNFEGASRSVYIMMMDTDGSLLGSFDNNGDATIPLSITANSLDIMACHVQSDDKIVIGGQVTSADFIGSNMITLRVHAYDLASGITDHQAIDFKVYPNPVHDHFQIDGHVDQVQLINFSGQVVQEWEAQERYNLPQGLVPGIYFISILQGNIPTVAKIIIQ